MHQKILFMSYLIIKIKHMPYVTIILISLSLAMDAFTVSIVDGLTMKNLDKRKMLFICLMFGLFQGLFPFIAHFIGLTFMSYIEDYDHWISLALLAFIGGKMIYDGIKEVIERKKNKEEIKDNNVFSYKKVIFQAIATSIDAFAVGITLESSVGGLNIYIDILFIILITFICCVAGIFLGKQITKLLKGHYEIADFIGGTILILIGVKIVLSHLGVIPF